MILRSGPTDKFERLARERGFRFIAGVDEAGRGPLAGPVVAAACMLPEEFDLEGVDDSKKLTPAQRQEIYLKLTQHPEVISAVGVVDSILIDQINILRATLEAMILAVSALSKRPDYLLIDGNQLPKFDIPCQAIVHGDSLSRSIAAASIIAKVTRDRMMQGYHAEWPAYGFDQHKGYGTAQHLAAIQAHGPCPIHRLSFEPIKSFVS